MGNFSSYQCWLLFFILAQRLLADAGVYMGFRSKYQNRTAAFSSQPLVQWHVNCLWYAEGVDADLFGDTKSYRGAAQSAPASLNASVACLMQ